MSAKNDESVIAASRAEAVYEFEKLMLLLNAGLEKKVFGDRESQIAEGLRMIFHNLMGSCLSVSFLSQTVETLTLMARFANTQALFRIVENSIELIPRNDSLSVRLTANRARALVGSTDAEAKLAIDQNQS